ncbi:uncharacterized protein RMCC_6080 [Mycolicibacterium canariasense]|uniref:histidine kinase n=1 Tax=Mycolicibacterium canariasense TaxID=228230 RepID=A0A100WJ35_MYCCR|nr:histidine kinase [Mycolicibacterium canariasense]MCV7208141.1 histidine kinase [Mycolicibacterium canariasense]ORV09515.1 hypothetical protein AWB94_09690 [Mycolicibacterium canariasense]GAS99115.1 uncharacterized protein RMCC_6080 [Mycolicibacterium canariasense]
MHDTTLIRYAARWHHRWVEMWVEIVVAPVGELCIHMVRWHTEVVTLRMSVRVVVVALTAAFAVTDMARGVGLAATASAVFGVATWCAAMPRAVAHPLWRYGLGAAIGAVAMFGVLSGSAAATVALAVAVSLTAGAFPVNGFALAASCSVIAAAGALTCLARTAQLSDSSAIVVPVAVGAILGLRSVEVARTSMRQRELHDIELRAAAAEERARLSRDLHDVLAHSLGALVIQLDALGVVAERSCSGTDVVGRVRAARAMAVQGLDEARQAVHDLRRFTEPVDVVVARLADQLAEQGWGTLHVTVNGTPPVLPPAITDLLGTVAVEGVSNICRHSSAAEAYAEVHYTAAGVVLCLRNRAAEPGAMSGWGLRGLRERAQAVGAELVAGWEAGVWELRCEATT